MLFQLNNAVDGNSTHRELVAGKCDDVLGEIPEINENELAGQFWRTSRNR